MTPRWRDLAIALGCAVASGGVDFASKEYILRGLGLVPGDAVEVIPGILTFVMSWNYGINFGLLASDSGLMRAFLVGLPLAVTAGLLVWTFRRAPDAVFACGAGLIIGGALGNAWDRFAYGAVADFLNVTCCGIDNPFAFNIADIAIFLGAALLILRTGGEDGHKKT